MEVRFRREGLGGWEDGFGGCILNTKGQNLVSSAMIYHGTSTLMVGDHINVILC